jgi:hypothetical protein
LFRLAIKHREAGPNNRPNRSAMLRALPHRSKGGAMVSVRLFLVSLVVASAPRMLIHSPAQEIAGLSFRRIRGN